LRLTATTEPQVRQDELLRRVKVIVADEAAAERELLLGE
jgi:hypothetical protein